MANEFEPKNDDFQTVRKDAEPLGYGTNGRRILTGFILIAGLIGVGAFGVYAYNKGKEDGRSGIPPIIKPKEGPTKVRPEHPGGMKVPNRDKEVFRRFGEKTRRPKVEIILEAPEEPRIPTDSKEKILNNEEPNGQNKNSMLQISEKPLNKKKSGLKRIATRAISRQENKIKQLGTKEPTEHKASKGMKYFKVQLASLRSENSVKNAWRLIIKNNSDLVGKLTLNIERKDLGTSRGVYYRMQAGSFSTRAEAQALCAKLKARGVSCIVIGG